MKCCGKFIRHSSIKRSKRKAKMKNETGGRLQIKCQILLVQYKQQANPLLSMHNYAPLVISGNDKNMQRTLLSQCKLTFAEIPYMLKAL
jgi:hypothetical protein